MPNSNPGREMFCPKCPKRMRYVTTRNADGGLHHKGDAFQTSFDTHVYECATHGRYHVGPNGRVVPGS